MVEHYKGTPALDNLGIAGTEAAEAVDGKSRDGNSRRPSAAFGHGHAPPFEELLAQLRIQHERELRLARREIYSSQDQSTSSYRLDNLKRQGSKALYESHDGHTASVRSTQSSEFDEGHRSEEGFSMFSRSPHQQKKSLGSDRKIRHSRDLTASDYRNGIARLCELPESSEPSEIHFTLLPEWVGHVNHNSSSAVKFEKLVPKDHMHHKVMMAKSTAEKRTFSFRLRLAMYSILHSIKLRRSFVHPSSKARAAWDSLGLVVLAFDLFWIPMQVFKPGDGTLIQIFEMLTLWYWTLDIMLSFISGYYEPSGHLVMQCRRIALRYLKGWFVLDVTIVGIDWILFAFKGQMNSSVQSVGIARIVKVMRGLRIMRTLRLLRVMKLREFLYAIQERVDSEYMMIMLSMMQNLTGLIILNHYMACVWFWIGLREGHGSWVAVYDVETEHFWTKYLISLRWTLVQFTPGGSNMQPQNNVERLLAVVILLMAVLVGSTIISSITAAMTRLRNLKGNQLAQFFMLRKFLNQNMISRDLSTRLTRYIRLTVELQRQRIGRSKVELLGLLSGPLDVELQTELLAPTLVNNDFFRGYMEISHAAMSQICYLAASSKAYSKGDAIFSVSSLCREMLFVQRGTMYYRRMKQVRGVPRRSVVDLGDWSCEAALWIDNWVHLGTMRALIESEALAVSSVKFREITSSFHDVFQFAKLHACDFMRRVRDELAKFGHTWDIPRRIMMPGEDTSSLGEGNKLLSERELKKQEVLEEDIIIDSSESEYDDSDEEVAQRPSIQSNGKFSQHFRPGTATLNPRDVTGEHGERSTATRDAESRCEKQNLDTSTVLL